LSGSGQAHWASELGFTGAACNYRPMKLAIVDFNNARSIGLERYPSIPAARHSSSAPFIACAVKAMRGVQLPPFSALRISRVASYPRLIETTLQSSGVVLPAGANDEPPLNVITPDAKGDRCSLGAIARPSRVSFVSE
jgi:hypothetical protein